MARQDGRTPVNPGIVPHPVYTEWAEPWRRLYDVYEGAGGFADSSRPYLYAHPREWLDHSTKIVSEENPTGKWVVNPAPTKPSPKLKARRKIARYENIAATLVDQLAQALFRKPPTRTFEDSANIPPDHPLRQFWENADGTGRAIQPCIREWWTGAAVFGHTGLYADLLQDAGETQADRAPIYVRAYTPLDIIDWLTDDKGQLVAVRLLEAVTRTTFSEAAQAITSQVRDVTADDWKVTQVTGQLGVNMQPGESEPAGEAHPFGRLPFVMLYAKRRSLLPTIGRSVLGDPSLYIDLYNLDSETRELLRNQTFGILNVPLGPEGTIEREMSLIGETNGTANILFSSQAADYISPDGNNVAMYHEHKDKLVRTIYRLAVVGWDSDSKDAESADSRKLKKEDLHQMLAGYASECEAVERTLVEFVYRAAYGDAWKTQMDKDQPSVSYPDEFDVTGLLDELEAAMQAQNLELGETATREVKKRVIPKLLPNLPQATMAKIEGEIDALEVKTAAQREAELMQMRLGTMPPDPSAQGDGDPRMRDSAEDDEPDA